MKILNSLRCILIVASFTTALIWLPQSQAAENKPLLPVESAKPGYDLEITDGQLLNAPKGRGTEATLGNVVDALRDRYARANLVLSPGLAKVMISDLKLRAGTLHDELEAIRVASGLKFEWLGPGAASPNSSPGSSPQTIEPTTGQPAERSQTEANAGLFILREPAPTPETARTLEAFNIGGYLQWLREKQDPKAAPDRREQEVAKSLDELEKIVAETLESLKPGSSVDRPSFRFHRGANLLIVTGTRDAVEVARQVVNALPAQSGLAGGEPNSAVPIASGMSPEQAKRYGLRVPPGMNPELANRYGLLAPTAPPAPAPPR